MKLTNKLGLPDTFYKAVLNDKYSRGDADYSATDLINPPQITLLKKRHDEEIEEDVSDMIWALLGKATHSILESADDKNAITEERIFLEIADRVISGQTDLYSEDRKVSDYKVTSVWTSVYGSRMEEWTEQLNIYAYLYRSQGFQVDKLQIIALYRDWSHSNAIKDSKYPQCMVEVIPIELWTEARQRDFIIERVELLKKYENEPDEALLECTFEERWETPTRYALMKEGKKSAVRVFDTNEELDHFLKADPNKYLDDFEYNFILKKDYSIEVRAGKRNRCTDYCAVNKFCSQYQEYLKDNNRLEVETVEKLERNN